MTSEAPALKPPASKAAATTVAPILAIGTEVFLLNSATDRNASAGLPTFTVTAAHTATPSTPALVSPAGLSAPPSTAPKSAHPTTTITGAVIQRIYSLTPTSNTFEVPGDRLLSAEGTFQLGETVRQKTAMLNARVEARYVVDGKVRYDVRDELETVVQGVGRNGEASVVNGLVKVKRGEFWPVEMGKRR